MAFDKSKFRVLNDQVFLRRLKEQDARPSGLILPNTKYDKNLVCEVLGVGPGLYSDMGKLYPATHAKVGDHVIVRQFEGVKFDKVNPNLFFVTGLVVEAIVDIDENTNIVDLRPCFDYLVIKGDPVATKTAGGLFKPDVTQIPEEWGTVVAAGPGYYHSYSGDLVPTEVSPGDRVVYAPFCGYKVEIRDVEYMMCREFDLFGYEHPALQEATA